MTSWILYAFLIALFAYLLGSIPTGYLAGKLVRGIDIREHGSKSTGATNVLREVGKVPAVIVLLVDVLKGFLAVKLTEALYYLPSLTGLARELSIDLEIWRSWAVMVAGLLAVFGHSWSLWLKFSGGKSAATGLGVLFALSEFVGLGTAIGFASMVGITRIVSISSMAACILSVILMVTLQKPFPSLLFAILASIYVIWRHRSNIKRLIAGTEPKIGQKHQEPQIPSEHN